MPPVPRRRARTATAPPAEQVEGHAPPTADVDLLPPPSPLAHQPAAYATTPEVAERAGRAAAAMPPLAEDDLGGLVKRFKEHLAPDEAAQFDPDGWVRSVNAHNESSGLRPEGGRECGARARSCGLFVVEPAPYNRTIGPRFRRSEPGFSVVNVHNRPAWDEMYFFLNPFTTDEKKPTAFSVNSQSQRVEMLSRGYIELDMLALSRDPRKLPPRLETAAAQGARNAASGNIARAGSSDAALGEAGEAGGPDPAAWAAAAEASAAAAARERRTAMFELPTNCKLPKVDKKKDATTAAEQVIAWIEQDVIVEGNT